MAKRAQIQNCQKKYNIQWSKQSYTILEEILDF